MKRRITTFGALAVAGLRFDLSAGFHTPLSVTRVNNHISTSTGHGAASSSTNVPASRPRVAPLAMTEATEATEMGTSNNTTAVLVPETAVDSGEAKPQTADGVGEKEEVKPKVIDGAVADVTAPKLAASEPPEVKAVVTSSLEAALAAARAAGPPPKPAPKPSASKPAPQPSAPKPAPKTSAPKAKEEGEKAVAAASTPASPKPAESASAVKPKGEKAVAAASTPASPKPAESASAVKPKGEKAVVAASTPASPKPAESASAVKPKVTTAKPQAAAATAEGGAATPNPNPKAKGPPTSSEGIKARVVPPTPKEEKKPKVVPPKEAEVMKIKAAKSVPPPAAEGTDEAESDAPPTRPAPSAKAPTSKAGVPADSPPPKDQGMGGLFNLGAESLEEFFGIKGSPLLVDSTVRPSTVKPEELPLAELDQGTVEDLIESDGLNEVTLKGKFRALEKEAAERQKGGVTPPAKPTAPAQRKPQDPTTSSPFAAFASLFPSPAPASPKKDPAPGPAPRPGIAAKAPTKAAPEPPRVVAPPAELEVPADPEPSSPAPGGFFGNMFGTPVFDDEIDTLPERAEGGAGRAMPVFAPPPAPAKKPAATASAAKIEVAVKAPAPKPAAPSPSGSGFNLFGMGAKGPTPPAPAPAPAPEPAKSKPVAANGFGGFNLFGGAASTPTAPAVEKKAAEPAPAPAPKAVPKPAVEGFNLFAGLGGSPASAPAPAPMPPAPSPPKPTPPKSFLDGLMGSLAKQAPGAAPAPVAAKKAPLPTLKKATPAPAPAPAPAPSPSSPPKINPAAPSFLSGFMGGGAPKPTPVASKKAPEPEPVAKKKPAQGSANPFGGLFGSSLLASSASVKEVAAKGVAKPKPVKPVKPKPSPLPAPVVSRVKTMDDAFLRKVSVMLKRNQAKIKKFQQLTDRFRGGLISAKGYFNEVEGLFGEANVEQIIDPLLEALPEKDKRRALKGVFDRTKKTRSGPVGRGDDGGLLNLLGGWGKKSAGSPAPAPASSKGSSGKSARANGATGDPLAFVDTKLSGVNLKLFRARTDLFIRGGINARNYYDTLERVFGKGELAAQMPAILKALPDNKRTLLNNVFKGLGK